MSTTLLRANFVFQHLLSTEHGRLIEALPFTLRHTAPIEDHSEQTAIGSTFRWVIWEGNTPTLKNSEKSSFSESCFTSPLPTSAEKKCLFLEDVKKECGPLNLHGHSVKYATTRTFRTGDRWSYATNVSFRTSALLTARYVHALNCGTNERLTGPAAVEQPAPLALNLMRPTISPNIYHAAWLGRFVHPAALTRLQFIH
ncbi:uncharacterized protein BT62DRAFT_1010163 [Guyanagaster necrorhizus]|uniref:Uncharacterized protein n=1 Tax=Guyanagaster necrorhizus TaxID=856835 RepID=A0A9P8AP91_9AGAR|nr:uncharacterized protein BT62DRAFT_1010163 [Guyanagaster necrorhizus MCA 3950]KAG7442566.1 hypothetical protein BT62DRAFT_1010163 [Guyanagaster necrorhizus MCA 3950]